MDILKTRVKFAARATKAANFRYSASIPAFEAASRHYDEASAPYNEKLKVHKAYYERTGKFPPEDNAFLKAKREAQEAQKAKSDARAAMEEAKHEAAAKAAMEAEAKEQLRLFRYYRPRNGKPRQGFGVGGGGEGDEQGDPSSSFTERMQTPLPQEAIDAYHTEAGAAFEAGFSAMTTFPEPPAVRCVNSSCYATKETRKLEACPCNIRAIFAGVTDLKKLRNNYHPDKYAVVEAAVPGAQAKAAEIFVVLSGMLS